MKRIPRITFKMLAAGLVFLAAALAHAQNPPHFQITIAPGTPAAKTIVDGDENDTDKNPDAIEYNAQLDLGPAPTVPVVIDIHAIQNVAGGGNVNLRIDRLKIINRGQGGVGNPTALTSSIIVVSGVFNKPVGGPPPAQPFFGRVHLDGKYTSRGFIFDEKVALSGFILQSAPAQNVLLGTVDIPRVQNQQGPVAFGPLAPPKELNTAPFSVGPTPDAAKQFPFAVTQLSMELSFTLNGSGDTLILPGSAFVVGYTADHVFTVNSIADLPDGIHPLDTVCDTGTVSTGTFPTHICTLRAALTESNFLSTFSAIQFNIPGTGVPRITVDNTVSGNEGNMNAANVIIDGTTQPGGLVELNGRSAPHMDFAGNTIVGLNLDGANSTVQGMVINDFPLHAIQINPTGSPINGNNVIEQNLIGTDITGLIAIPNGGDGVHIVQMPNNSILDNVIANNAGQGVSVGGSAATGNRIHANSITANGGLGIALTGGGNNLQPAPGLSSATEDGSDLTIGGTIHSTSASTITLDFFVNTHCNPSGEGAHFLGSTQTITNGSGNATFSAVLPANDSEGSIATATATDPLGNTSQFSACATITSTVPPNQPPVANAGPNQTVLVETLVTLNGTASSDPDNGPSSLTFQWTQTSGPIVTLTGLTTATPSFTPTQPGTYVFTLVVNDGLQSSLPASVTITVNTSALAVQVTSSGFLFSRVTRTFNGTVTVANIGGSAIPAPINVGFTGLPATVTLVNATFVVAGVPFITLPGGLAPGQSASFTVQFSNPSNVNITFSPIVN